jgi:hypothetical protein
MIRASAPAPVPCRTRRREKADVIVDFLSGAAVPPGAWGDGTVGGSHIRITRCLSALAEEDTERPDGGQAFQQTDRQDTPAEVTFKTISAKTLDHSPLSH